MDIFNRKRVKELEEQLRRASASHPTVYVSKGDAIPLVTSIYMSEHDMEIPVEILQRRLCEKLANAMFERNLVRFEVTDDPRVRIHILHARIDVINRG